MRNLYTMSFLFGVLLAHGHLLGESLVFRDQRIRGVFTHQNLDVYLVHGEDRFHEKVVTLDEALEKNYVVLDETGKVNHLTIENVTGDVRVFIQGGDIVKGGKQDRTIRDDHLLEPRSGKVSIDAFCVEQGRWRKRGGENEYNFSSSKKALASKDLKMAAKVGGSQGAVWNQVAATQEKLERTLDTSVRSIHSQTSLQLTMEDVEVEKEAREMVKGIEAQMGSSSDTLGFIYSINGEIQGADIYASHALFKKLWPKMMEACAVEALSEKGGVRKGPATLKEVVAWLRSAEEGRETERRKKSTGEVRVKDSKDNVSFDCYFPFPQSGEKNKWIHKNILSK